MSVGYYVTLAGLSNTMRSNEKFERFSNPGCRRKRVGASFVARKVVTQDESDKSRKDAVL